ncbi:lipopolysaccharide assembly protein LapB [Chromatium okenii]|jgi:tetratricopeptide (TPR) repeat protein|uniref:tetratricopeptide repeat protein n=1 Tax=Chromatium okenii TaxID=61644 RepID=UPI0026EE2F17|nr:tetratricopeptide repeat protein [Chromatium okenii]MBV5309711.1 tetratricopeptide repeat protein [Chromatium okenii]
MPNIQHLRLRPLADVMPILLLVLAVVVIWVLYGLALPGRFMFDDSPNLAPLREVHDWLSALGFITSGQSGPLGRPLALATFAMQSAAWPDHPAAMLRVNFAIHLAAVGACFTLTVGLARLRLPTPRRAPLWIGLGVATLWGLSPFLATTHLMVIQRMSSLAGLLVLAGLAAFVWAHLFGAARPMLARVYLVVGLGVATALAAFTKENGALLPLLALVILWLWIPRERRFSNPVNRTLIVLLAVLPSTLLLVYLASLVPGLMEHGYGPARYFTPTERLLSQPAIVLDYLHNLMLPRAASVSPYMDRLPVPQGWLEPPITLIATVVWALLLGLAVWLRRIAPYLLFGLAFFLVGHVLESGIIGLELYFAHRNYVPAFGLYFALLFAAASVPIVYRRLAIISLAVYVFMFGVVLFQVTSSWNDAQWSGESWLRHNPYSERSAQFLATNYIEQGNFIAARQVFDFAAQKNPDVPLIQIQRTMICLNQEDQFPALLSEVSGRLRTAIYEHMATVELVRFARGNPSELCPKRNHAALAAMADALLDNPAYANSAPSKSALLLTKGFVSAKLNVPDEAVPFAMQAYRLNNDLDTAFFTASIIANAGQSERARRFLEEVRLTAPNNPLTRNAWLKRLDEFIATELL